MLLLIAQSILHRQRQRVLGQRPIPARVIYSTPLNVNHIYAVTLLHWWKSWSRLHVQRHVATSLVLQQCPQQFRPQSLQQHYPQCTHHECLQIDQPSPCLHFNRQRLIHHFRQQHQPQPQHPHTSSVSKLPKIFIWGYIRSMIVKPLKHTCCIQSSTIVPRILL